MMRKEGRKDKADVQWRDIEFTNQLEGYEGVTAQCHNCELCVQKYMGLGGWFSMSAGGEMI